MSSVETRYPCPVCLGVTLEKSGIEGGSSFVLDHCTRCGGAWFDHGEVQKLRACTPDDLWKQVARRTGMHAMQCHSCDHLLERSADTCPQCGWAVRLDCPSCGRPMEKAEHAGITLDACQHCRGVWFDHHELVAIWKQEFSAALARRHLPVRGDAAAYVVLDAITMDPFFALYGAHAAGHVLAAGAQAAPGVLEAAGEAAGGLFETIADLIAGIFG